MRKILLLVLLLSPFRLFSQSFYEYTPDARITAMGGAAVATHADAFATFGNAASVLMDSRITQFAFSYVNFAEERYRKYSILSLGGYVRFLQKHALILGARFTIEPHTTYSYKRSGIQHFELSYGNRLSQQLSIATTVRYSRSYRHFAGRNNINGYGADVSLFLSLPVNILENAMVNIGGKISFDKPSYRYYGYYNFSSAVGMSLSMPITDEHIVDIATEVKYGALKNEDIVACKLGVEYSLMRLLFFRIGSSALRVVNLQTIPYMSIGTGFRFFHLQFDISYLVGRKESPFHKAVQVNFGVEF